MSDYGIFEASATDGHEEEQRQRQAKRDLGTAIEAAREGFGDFLGSSTDKDDYQDRLALVMNDLMQKVADSGVMPVPGVMRKVKAALRPEFRKTAAPQTEKLEVSGHEVTLVAHDDGEWEFVVSGPTFQHAGVGPSREDVMSQVEESIRTYAASRKQSITVAEMPRTPFQEYPYDVREVINDLVNHFGVDRDDLIEGGTEGILRTIEDMTELIGEESYNTDLSALYKIVQQHTSSRKQAAEPSVETPWGTLILDSPVIMLDDEDMEDVGTMDLSNPQAILESYADYLDQAPPVTFPEFYRGASRRQAGIPGWTEAPGLSEPSYVKVLGDGTEASVVRSGSKWSWSLFNTNTLQTLGQGEEGSKKRAAEVALETASSLGYTASRKQANNYEEIADRAADDFERETGMDPYTNPSFITQYLPAWASAKVPNIAFDPALYEELEMEANMLGYGYTVEGKRKQAASWKEVNPRSEGIHPDNAVWKIQGPNGLSGTVIDEFKSGTDSDWFIFGPNGPVLNRKYGEPPLTVDEAKKLVEDHINSGTLASRKQAYNDGDAAEAAAAWAESLGYNDPWGFASWLVGKGYRHPMSDSEYQQHLQEFQAEDDPGVYGSRKQASAVDDLKSYVESKGVTTTQKDKGFTFPTADGAKGHVYENRAGEIVVQTLIGGSGGVQSNYTQDEVDLVKEWVDRTASIKTADSDTDARWFFQNLKGKGYTMPKDAGRPGDGGDFDDFLDAYANREGISADELRSFLTDNWDEYAYGHPKDLARERLLGGSRMAKDIRSPKFEIGDTVQQIDGYGSPKWGVGYVDDMWQQHGNWIYKVIHDDGSYQHLGQPALVSASSKLSSASELAERAADDYEEDTGNDVFISPDFLSQYLPAWASANARNISYEELKAAAEMEGFGGHTASRKQAFSEQLGVHLTEVFESGEAGGGWRPITGERLDWEKGYLEFYGGSGFFRDYSDGDDGEDADVFTFSTDDDAVIIDAAWKVVDYANGNLASRKQASDIDLDDMGVLNFFYQFEDEGLEPSAPGDEQWEWLKNNVDYDILQDKIDLAYEHGEIGRGDADSMAYDLQQTFFGSRKVALDWSSVQDKVEQSGWDQMYADYIAWALDNGKNVEDTYSFVDYSDLLGLDAEEEQLLKKFIQNTAPRLYGSRKTARDTWDDWVNRMEDEEAAGTGYGSTPGWHVDLPNESPGDEDIDNPDSENPGRFSRRKTALDIDGSWEEELLGIGYASCTPKAGGGFELYMWSDSKQSEALDVVGTSEEARRIWKEWRRSDIPPAGNAFNTDDNYFLGHVKHAGGTDFATFAEGSSAQEAFNNAKAEAKQMYGDDGYTGSIAEKDSFEMASRTPMTDEEAKKFIWGGDGFGKFEDKWGPAGCIELDTGGFVFFGIAST